MHAVARTVQVVVLKLVRGPGEITQCSETIQ